MDTSWLPVLLGLSMGGLGLFVAIQFRRSRKALWRRVADELGLEYVDKGWFKATDGMVGELDGVPIAVSGFTRSSGKNRRVYTRIKADAPGLDGFRLDHEGLGVGLMKVLGAEDHEVGDPGFDERVRVRGDSKRALATLGPEQRLATIRLLDVCESARLEDQKIGYETALIHNSEAKLKQAIVSVADGARAFSTAGPVERWLRERAASDPSIGVRIHALDVLVAGHPGPETEALLDEASTSSDARLSGAVRRLRGEASAGGLALAEDAPQQGSLSVAEAPEGALSEAAEQTPARRPKQPS